MTQLHKYITLTISSCQKLIYETDINRIFNFNILSTVVIAHRLMYSKNSVNFEWRLERIIAMYLYKYVYKGLISASSHFIFLQLLHRIGINRTQQSLTQCFSIKMFYDDDLLGGENNLHNGTQNLIR